MILTTTHAPKTVLFASLLETIRLESCAGLKSKENNWGAVCKEKWLVGMPALCCLEITLLAFVLFMTYLYSLALQQCQVQATGTTVLDSKVIVVDLLLGLLFTLCRAQDLINKRFVGVTGLCLKELTASFSLCAAQIITCLNNMTAECVQQVTRYYMYGCNKGALVPKPDVDENRMHLKQFCTANGPSSALSCNQHKRNIDLTFAEPTSFCLPGSCSAQLDVIAKTMMNLQCSFLNSTELVCGLAEVDVNCQPANCESPTGNIKPFLSC